MSVKTYSPLKSWDFLRFWDWYYRNLGKLHLEGEQKGKSKILPAFENVFKALELTPFDKVKVVLLGQDPYHTKGYAHGLAFSVQAHVKKLPPSLRMLFKELQEDIGCKAPRTGDLTEWAKRGVLLLNTSLTVEEGKANSHKGLGWEKLTYEVIKALDARQGVAFLLMGKQAQEYRAAASLSPVVCTPHPSPLAKGFLGSKPYSRVNAALKEIKVEEVDWRL